MAVCLLTLFKRYLEAKCSTVQSLWEHHPVWYLVLPFSCHLTKAVAHQALPAPPPQTGALLSCSTATGETQLEQCQGNVLASSTTLSLCQTLWQPPPPASGENKAVCVQQTSPKPSWHHSEGFVAVF